MTMLSEQTEIEFSDDEVLEHPFIDDDGRPNFYIHVFDRYCKDKNIDATWDKNCEALDCTRLTISEKMWNTWKEQLSTEAMLTLMATSGPKCEIGVLDKNIVRLQPGCITIIE